VLKILERAPSVAVAVIGDAFLDVYIDATSSRLSREAPVPVVHRPARRSMPGGGANTAANVAGIGAQAILVSVVGSDEAGLELRRLLSGYGVDVQWPPTPRLRTATKTRVLADGQLLVRIDEGDPAPETVRRRVARLVRELGPVAALVAADYGDLFDGDLRRTVADEADRRGVPLVVDARRPSEWRGARCTVLKANREEAETLGRADEHLLGDVAAGALAITLDREGSLLIERGRPPVSLPGRRAEGASAVGAGDTYTAALAIGLACGEPLPLAGELASYAAGNVVGRRGTSVCLAADLRAELEFSSADAELIAAAVARRRAAGERIVLTNGCFDLLHAGHVSHLAEARALGDVLVVAVNDDPGVRALKGAGRPVMALPERLAMLAALASVDYVLPFSGPDACDVVRRLRPTLYVKGAEGPEPPEAAEAREVGADVRILPLVGGHQTSIWLDRIRRAGAA
jgi:D-beta-D-heptose 7-phosphate kinase / D-beta-D-heptose 1-phosphate adenosyltransferase